MPVWHSKLKRENSVHRISWQPRVANNNVHVLDLSGSPNFSGEYWHDSAAGLDDSYIALHQSGNELRLRISNTSNWQAHLLFTTLGFLDRRIFHPSKPNQFPNIELACGVHPNKGAHPFAGWSNDFQIILTTDAPIPFLFEVGEESAESAKTDEKLPFGAPIGFGEQWSIIRSLKNSPSL
jgi:hypothetical protein